MNLGMVAGETVFRGHGFPPTGPTFPQEREDRHAAACERQRCCSPSSRVSPSTRTGERSAELCSAPGDRIADGWRRLVCASSAASFTEAAGLARFWRCPAVRKRKMCGHSRVSCRGAQVSVVLRRLRGAAARAPVCRSGRAGPKAHDAPDGTIHGLDAHAEARARAPLALVCAPDARSDVRCCLGPACPTLLRTLGLGVGLWGSLFVLSVNLDLAHDGFARIRVCLAEVTEPSRPSMCCSRASIHCI